MNAHHERVAEEVAELLIARDIFPEQDDGITLSVLPDADRLVIGKKLLEVWDREILINTSQLREESLASILLQLCDEADGALFEEMDSAHREAFRDSARNAA